METFQPHCKQSKSEVKTQFPAGRGRTLRVSGRSWHLRWTFKCECILIGGGPEGEEGQKGLARKEKNTSKGKVMGKKAGLERKEFGLGMEQGPRKVVAEKAGKKAGAIPDEPGRAAVELGG